MAQPVTTPYQDARPINGSALAHPPTRKPKTRDDQRPAPAKQASGETKRVRQLRAEVAEAHQLAGLQHDDTPLQIDTAKVRKHRKRAAEAARLHTLAQDPMTRAYRALRTRRRLIALAMVALALALGWSTAGVQAFAAEGAPMWSPRWMFAWLVEPFMSLALIVVVGARAYLATLDQPIESVTLVRIERLFLGLTVGMNAWPYLPWVADKFTFSSLVLHVLGPIVAVSIVIALPIILAAFTRLDLGLTRPPAERPAEPVREVSPVRYLHRFRTERRTEPVAPMVRISRRFAFSRQPMREPARVLRRAFAFRRAAARTGPVRTAYVFRTRPVTPVPEAVDRDVFVREITADILASAAQNEKWSPDYDRLMERAKRSRSWCEKAVHEARKAVFGKAARTGEATA